MVNPELQNQLQTVFQTEECFRWLVESVRDYAIYMLDPQGRIVSWNLGAQRIKGYTSEEIIGQHVSCFFTPEAVEAGLPSLELETATSEGRFECEGWRVRADGSRFWANVTVTALRDEQDNLRGFAKVTQDITERKKSEMALREAKENLENQVQKRTRTLANAIAKLKAEIASRKQIEVQLRESEQRFRAIFDLAAVGISQVALDGRWLLVNQRLCDIVGYSREELLDTNFQAITHPEDIEEDLLSKQRMLAGQLLTYSMEKRYIRKNGSFVWVNLTVSLVRRPTGEAKYFISIVEDITERKRTQAALQDSKNRYRTLAKVSPVGIFRTDKAGNWVYANERAWEILGMNRKQAIGQGWVDALHPLDRQRVLQQWQQAMQQQVSFQAEYRFIRPDGVLTWVLGQAVSEKGKNGEITGFVGTITDITDRKQAEQAREMSEAQLRQQARQLEQTLHELRSTQVKLIHSEKMSSLGQLVAGLAHEINNPVNFIYGNLDHAGHYLQDMLNLLQIYRHYIPESVPEIQQAAEEIDLDFIMADTPKLLASMQQGADRIRQIVLSLRNFSRHDEAELKSVDIHEGIESTLLILQNRLQAKPGCPEIQVIKNFGDLPKIQCYAGQLNQVFMNILTNAIDALERASEKWVVGERKNLQPTINIQTEMLDKCRVAVRIADNGQGISSEVKQRLFDPFFTTKPVGSGTGLGLSISYQIVVEQHRGQLNCISEAGKGAQFIIEIPIKQVITNSITP